MTRKRQKRRRKSTPRRIGKPEPKAPAAPAGRAGSTALTLGAILLMLAASAYGVLEVHFSNDTWIGLAAGRLIERMNSKPVYTLRELQEGYVVRPQSILLLGGPAPQFAPHLEAISGLPVQVLPKWEVANAIGAALARTTCDVIFFADTEQQMAEAPEENFSCRIDASFDCDAAVRQACELLRSKAIACGANSQHLEIEVAEAQQFNMVRGFYTIGRNIRVRVQVQPGVIHGYDDLIARLATSP